MKFFTKRFNLLGFLDAAAAPAGGNAFFPASATLGWYKSANRP
jgi:hypothetical protein